MPLSRNTDVYADGLLVSSQALAVGLADENATTILAKAKQALAANAAFLALATPSSAQNAAQIKLLTREVNALLRLALSEFDDVSGT